MGDQLVNMREHVYQALPYEFQHFKRAEITAAVKRVPSGARKCPAFVRGLCSATSHAAQRILGSGARHSWHCSSATVRLPHARQYSHH
jgi:hypothetical protein